MVDVCVTDMLTLATSKTQTIHRNYYVAVDTTLVVHNAQNVVQVSSKKLGESRKLIRNSNANLAIVLTIVQNATMMLMLMLKDYLWIYMGIMKAGEFVRIANITQKAQIVINANQHSIDHIIKIGMKLMYATVSKKFDKLLQSSTHVLNNF